MLRRIRLGCLLPTASTSTSSSILLPLSLSLPQLKFESFRVSSYSNEANQETEHEQKQQEEDDELEEERQFQRFIEKDRTLVGMPDLAEKRFETAAMGTKMEEIRKAEAHQDISEFLTKTSSSASTSSSSSASSSSSKKSFFFLDHNEKPLPSVVVTSLKKSIEKRNLKINDSSQFGPRWFTKAQAEVQRGLAIKTNAKAFSVPFPQKIHLVNLTLLEPVERQQLILDSFPPRHNTQEEEEEREEEKHFWLISPPEKRNSAPVWQTVNNKSVISILREAQVALFLNSSSSSSSRLSNLWIERQLLKKTLNFDWKKEFSEKQQRALSCCITSELLTDLKDHVDSKDATVVIEPAQMTALFNEKQLEVPV